MSQHTPSTTITKINVKNKKWKKAKSFKSTTFDLMVLPTMIQELSLMGWGEGTVQWVKQKKKWIITKVPSSSDGFAFWSGVSFQNFQCYLVHRNKISIILNGNKHIAIIVQTWKFYEIGCFAETNQEPLRE
jgi:hypothetical protein